MSPFRITSFYSFWITIIIKNTQLSRKDRNTTRETKE